MPPRCRLCASPLGRLGSGVAETIRLRTPAAVNAAVMSANHCAISS